MINRLVVIALLSMLLSACQLRTSLDMGDYQSAEQIDRWLISGRLGYRTAEDGGSASVDWRQQPRAGQMNFSGPLGFGSAELTWKSGLATLKTSQGDYQARSPEELAWHLTGFWLPVSALQYWIRGLPWPGAPAEADYNEQGQLVALDQLGWQLRFDRHQSVGQISLPHRIRAEQQDNRFTLLVRSWQPGAP